MTSLLLDRPTTFTPKISKMDDRPTLDDVLTSAWEGLSSDRAVSCPVCRGRMAPRYGSGSGAVGGRCTSCGSVLG